MSQPVLPLGILQTGILNRLDPDRWFDRIPVITEQLGDIANAVELSVGKLGTCVVVETPVANLNYTDLPGVYLDDVPIVVTVWENVIINQSNTGSQKHALDTALIVLALLHQYLVPELADANGNMPLVIARPQQTIVKSPDPELLGYHVNLRTNLGFRYTPEASVATESNADLLTEAGFTIIKEGS